MSILNRPEWYFRDFIYILSVFRQTEQFCLKGSVYSLCIDRNSVFFLIVDACCNILDNKITHPNNYNYLFYYMIFCCSFGIKSWLWTCILYLLYLVYCAKKQFISFDLRLFLNLRTIMSHYRMALSTSVHVVYSLENLLVYHANFNSD